MNASKVLRWGVGLLIDALETDIFSLDESIIFSHRILNLFQEVQNKPVSVIGSTGTATFIEGQRLYSTMKSASTDVRDFLRYYFTLNIHKNHDVRKFLLQRLVEFYGWS